ncbi:hypothetical protein [Entomospira culicis]|uniref:Uncharacterized protein n=1 Tax=Entomospira culicis TaxID=2719989 RepID=A0A968KWG0_9SPIO|nr:hypothetical protein [Entomospira culicis]NIZ18957.1 hypothetical protein [Entomospira culicis]NIZ69172.1 hypothetical protein [Entomospira culicis]WDI37759.1 hypothetical protein PVA46_02955 [Entomospira culicis]WDI39387.1 hypothetical protein PVA47_02960 [Entomospira culicis]
MKKLLFLPLFALFIACQQSNNTQLLQQIIEAPYGSNQDSIKKVFPEKFYSSSQLSQETILQSIASVDFLKSALDNFAHRTQIKTFQTIFYKETYPLIVFFDQDQLYAQLIPFTPMSAENFRRLFDEASAHLGAPNEEERQSHQEIVIWNIPQQNAFLQIAYNHQSQEGFLLLLNYEIRMQNDLRLFKELNINPNFLANIELGQDYATVIKEHPHFYAAAHNRETLVYLAKLNNPYSPIFYTYFFENDQLSSIFFQNIEEQEEYIIEIFNKLLQQSPEITTQKISDYHTIVSYSWKRENNTGALIVIHYYEGENQQQRQSQAVITENFNALRDQLL